MGYILKLNNAKQQINFLNCDNIDKWIDTCQEVTNSYDVVDDDIDLPIEGGSIGDGALVFEFRSPFVNQPLNFKLNGKTYSTRTSPYATSLEKLNITTLTDCSDTFFCSSYDATPYSISRLICFPDTSRVTNMYRMFCGCLYLTSLDLSSFDTSNVTNMNAMFNGCSGLTSLDLSNFNTSNVTNMYAMFYDCPNLTSLDLSNFDTSKVTDMMYMFQDCTSLTSLDLSSWVISKNTDVRVMFKNCTNLQTIYMRGCDQTSIDKIASVKPSQAQIITE